MQAYTHKQIERKRQRKIEKQTPKQTIIDDNKSPYIFVCRLLPFIVTLEFSHKHSFLCLFIFIYSSSSCSDSASSFSRPSIYLSVSFIHSLYARISFDLFLIFSFSFYLSPTHSFSLCLVLASIKMECVAQRGECNLNCDCIRTLFLMPLLSSMHTTVRSLVPRPQVLLHELHSSVIHL